MPRRSAIRWTHGMVATTVAAFGLSAACAIASPCAPHVQEHPGSSTAQFRAHTDAFLSCPVDESTYRRVVQAWLQDRPADAGALHSFFLGRAVQFPWLSRTLADTALNLPAWSARAQDAGGRERERMAGEVFADPVLRQRLALPFEGSSHVVVGISHEKVLFGRAGEHASNPRAAHAPVPFDAQVWLHLSPRHP